jgi:hypothetical protein
MSKLDHGHGKPNDVVAKLVEEAGMKAKLDTSQKELLEVLKRTLLA